MGAVHLIFAALFAVSAALQYNDPDPVGWALLYFAACVLAVGRSRGTPLRPFGVALAALCAVWMATLAGGMREFVERGDITLLAASMQAGDPVIEEAREFLGLAIVFLYSLGAGLARVHR